MRVVLPNACLVILCGPAGSGKSTFAQRNFSETAIVSSDRCRAMLTDDESNMRASADAFALFHQIIDTRLRLRRLTVADSTALHPDARRDLRRLARRWKTPITIVVFDVPEETCQRWNARRGRRVGRSVIHRQWQQSRHALQRIPHEGYDQVIILGEDDVVRARVEVDGRAAAAGERGT